MAGGWLWQNLKNEETWQLLEFLEMMIYRGRRTENMMLLEEEAVDVFCLGQNSITQPTIIVIILQSSK